MTPFASSIAAAPSLLGGSIILPEDLCLHGATRSVSPWTGEPGTALAVVLLGKLGSPAWLRLPLDISYGVYLYAFPVQQFVAGLGLTFWPSLALSTSATLVLAVASAIFIELPALQRRLRAIPKVREQAV